mgnify:CR=1 FL=1
MPIRTFNRVWCKECNDFSLHRRDKENKENLVCMSCGTVYTEVLLKDIPEEKILEQRQRYKRYQEDRLMDVYREMGLSSGERSIKEFLHMMSSPGDYDKDEIIESDAGQKLIDQQEREERNKKYEEWKIEQEKNSELKKQYKNLGRNDLCLCGSGKKFKHCCWDKLQKI